ncbi:MAG: hypothetical protein J2P46_03220 [Zavarzinella sp.]|nr:hypothetical protein [Zavarzinella sp.]
MTILRFLAPGLMLVAAGPLVAAPAGKDAATPHDESLALIPPKAIAVVQVNGIERVQERLNKLLQAAVPDKAEQASKAIRDGLADALEGRDLKSIRPDGRVLVAIADVERLPDDATLTFLFPVKDADEFKKGFLTDDERKSLKKDGDLETVKWEERDEPFYLVPIKGYVAISSDKDTAQKYAKGEIGGVAKQLTAETAKAFLDSDVSLFINVKEVNAKYGDQLKTFKGLAELFLKGDTVQGVNKAQMEQIKSIIDAAFQVLEDGTAAVLAVELRSDGLSLRGLAQFGEKTGTNEGLQKYKPTPLAQLGTLPTGQVSYSASALNLGGSKSAALLLGAMTADDEDAAAKKAIEGVLRDLGRLDRGVTLRAGQIMGGPGLEIIESKDAAKIVDARLQLLRALTKTGSFLNVPLKDKPEVKEKAESVGGFSLNAVTVKFDFDKAVVDLPEEGREAARSSMKRALGGDEMHLWFGSSGNQVLQVTAKDWGEAKGLVEAYLDKGRALEKDPAYQFTRKQLPAEATMLVALDAAQTVYSIFGMVKDTGGQAPGFPAQLPDLKSPDGKPAYLGIALVLKAPHGSFEVFVPASAVGQVRKLLEPLLDKGQ